MTAYYSTSYSFGSGTTSTIALMVWRSLSKHLLEHQAPMTAAELETASGITEEHLDSLFRQAYYKGHYGFRRFNSLADWTEWARESNLLLVPGVHDQPDEEELDEEELDEEAELEAEEVQQA